MTKREMKALRTQIGRHQFLFIVEDASNEQSLAVHDRREGRNLGTSIDSAESLDYLVEHGAEAWLNSRFNGMG